MPMATVIQALLLVGFPAAANRLADRYRIAGWLSPVVLCYGFGIVLGNLPFITINADMAHLLIQGTVALAIPMLLMASDLKAFARIGRPMLLSFALAIASVMVMSVAGSFLFGDRVADAWMVSGMLVGVYTGGTPNMNAIAVALDVPQETVVLVNAADLIMGSLYLCLLMTVAKPLLSKVMRPFPEGGGQGQPEHPESGMVADVPRVAPTDVLKALGAGALVVALAAGAAVLLTGGLSETVAILAITSLGIAGSAVAPLRRLPGMYETGQYLLLIFCVAIGALADVGQLMSSVSTVLGYCSFVLVGAIVLHLLLAWLFRIDVDTAIITSTAAVYGPPFVGPIANVLRNPAVAMPGITAGVVGLAVGNYLGIWLARLLQP